ncbi:2,5-diamino-6-(ribosylamino)-4(3H)-pyrimidinone 5'-phosphate reductase [Aspergillus melleus]|uniref:2,5-diamino-6-(Ribosylamino)-4(3H)-pyrimidinone 5'-phosphate reductase n=1 Tax=Aspergillus melleus TaxID=138277 RepID=A0ACC3AUF9_9EURO|nr:2,5-diamino-6-(ribosylamino)-4(3H)-pyrimidinone 5'-phosphate reductase [Aspergillus melleus]
MTHYLRSRHDAILIGVGTAIADNPGLNCRIAGVGGYGGEGLTGQPRPIVIDPTARWDFTPESKILALARAKQGLAPFIITGTHAPPPPSEKIALLERHGGKYIALDVSVVNAPPDEDDNDNDEVKNRRPTHRIDWTALLRCLREQGLRSVMIEGGGSIINSLLEPQTQHLIDSVVVTIAPTWLGRGGVVVSPNKRVDGHGVAIPASRLTDVKWYPLGEDVVLCGRIKGE